MKKFGILSMLLGCLIILSFVGCSDDEGTGLRGGFGTDGDVESFIKVAFESDKSKIKEKSNLELKLYYGRIDGFDNLDSLSTVSATIIMRSWFYEDDYQSPQLFEECIVKKIDDFTADSYNWIYEPQQNFTSGVESIVVPYEWFSRTEGAISWNIISLIVFNGDSLSEEQTEEGGISLYYIKQGEEILLFDSYFDFYNFKEHNN